MKSGIRKISGEHMIDETSWINTRVKIGWINRTRVEDRIDEISWMYEKNIS